MLCKQDGKADDPPHHRPITPSSLSPVEHGDGRELAGGLGRALEAKRKDENGAKKTRNAKVVEMGRTTHSMAGGLVRAANPSPATHLKRTIDTKEGLQS